MSSKVDIRKGRHGIGERGSADTNSILQKAAKLKWFVKQQRGKVERSKALHEWMVAQQRLRDECGAAERDAAQAQEAVAELLQESRGQTEGAGQEPEAPVDSADLRARVTRLWQHFAAERRRPGSSETLKLRHELQRLQEELAKDREELERQESSCAGANSSALCEESEMAADANWRTRLDDLFAHYPNACDAKEQADTQRAFETLETGFSTKLRDMEGTCPASSHVGWSPEDHETFLRVRRAGLAQASATCQPQAEVVARVCRMMPHRAQRDVVQHFDWYAERLLWQRKADDLHVSHARQLDEAFEKLTSKLSKKEAEFHSSAAAALDNMKREAAQTLLQTKLDNYRQIKAESAQLELLKRLASEEAELERKRQEERKSREERSKAKELLAKYRAEIDTVAREREKEAARGRALREEAVKAESQMNAERVAYRRTEHARKLEQLRRAAAASEEREREKEERLAKLRAKVAVQVEADEARVRQPTAAMAAAEAAAKDAELFPVHGFTTDELMRDRRFRLGVALREAGLHNTNAGREALMSAAPKVTKRDTLSQIRFAPENLPP